MKKRKWIVTARRFREFEVTATSQMRALEAGKKKCVKDEYVYSLREVIIK